MKKLLFSVLLFSTINASAQSWQWLKSPSAINSNMTYQGMSIDADENVYTIGQLFHNASFGTTTLESNSDYFSLYFAKQAPNGDFLFAKRIWADAGVSPSVIKTDAAGNSYIFGTCNGTMLHFGSTDSLAFPNGSSSASQSKFYMAKFDKNGALLWSKKGEGTSLYANARAIDMVGNSIIIAGDYYGDCTFLGQNFPNVAANTSFVLKLDAAGVGTWLTRSGNASMTFPTALANDGSSIYVTGKFQQYINFGSVMINNTVSPTGGERIYVVKLDANGNPLWGSQEGGIAAYVTTATTGNNSNALACDASGHVYVGGSYQDSTGNINTQKTKPFVSKYDGSNGTKLWSVFYAGAVKNAINGLAIDLNQDVVGVGEYTGAMAMDTFHLPTDNLKAKGMIFKLNKANGSCANVTGIGQNGYLSLAKQIVMKADKSGYFVGGIFNNSTRIEALPITSNGNNTCFNAKYSFGPPTSIKNQIATQFSLYPNPANDQLILEMKSALKGEVYIYNALGQQVYQKSINSASTLLDIQNLAPGSYYLKGIFGEQIATQRFTKN